MNKEDVQKRVLQNGKPLDLDLFTWNEKTKTFSSEEDNLVADFSNIDGCTFDTGGDCTFKTGDGCTFDTGGRCTFDTGGRCTFDTGWDCTFKTGDGCVIVNRNEFEVIQPKEGDVIQICPIGIEGHLVNGMYNGKPHIIVDGILSEVISKKVNIYKVKNYGQDSISYIVKSGEYSAHGKTIKQAREALLFKTADRDVSAYKNMPLNTVKSPTEWAAIYSAITGACQVGCQYFMEQKGKLKKTYTLAEILEETKGAYEYAKFKEVVS